MSAVLKQLESNVSKAYERFRTLQKHDAPRDTVEKAFQDFLLAGAEARGAFAALYPQRSGLDLPLSEQVAWPTTVTIEVEVRLDPVAGWGDNAEDFLHHVQHQMEQTIPHYLQSVKIRSWIPS